MPAQKWTELTPDMRHNIVIEHVKNNGGAFSIFEKIASYALLIVYALRLFVYISLSSFIRMGWNLVFRFSVSSIVYVSRWIWLTIPKLI